MTRADPPGGLFLIYAELAGAGIGPVTAA